MQSEETSRPSKFTYINFKWLYISSFQGVLAIYEELPNFFVGIISNQVSGRHPVKSTTKGNVTKAEDTEELLKPQATLNWLKNNEKDIIIVKN